MEKDTVQRSFQVIAKVIFILEHRGIERKYISLRGEEGKGLNISGFFRRVLFGGRRRGKGEVVIAG